ncbi:MAG: flagellar hook-length control protein FliK, partial [Paracoccus sp. (in: a-proteobacteria)]|nr:flagellar hook-length control protein FliK [Paracoccus sp. (in: a-proteobacteria)]
GQVSDSSMPLDQVPGTVYRSVASAVPVTAATPVAPVTSVTSVAQQVHNDVSSAKLTSAALPAIKVEAVGGSSTLAAPVPSAPQDLARSNDQPRENTTENSLPPARLAAAPAAVDLLTTTLGNAGDPPEARLRATRTTDSQHVIAPSSAPQTAVAASQEGAQIIAAAASSARSLKPSNTAQENRLAPESIALPRGLTPKISGAKISMAETSPLPQPEGRIATPPPALPQAYVTAEARPPATIEAQIAAPAFIHANQSEDLPLEAPHSSSAELTAPASTRDSAPQAVNIAQTTQHHRSISHQIGEAILRERNGDVEVTLTPEDLGSVRLSIRPGDGGHVITIWAERPETLEAARRAADLLQRDLRESGFGEAALSFSGGGQDNRSSPSQRPGISGDSPIQPVTPPATGQVSPTTGRLNIKV